MQIAAPEEHLLVFSSLDKTLRVFLRMLVRATSLDLPLWHRILVLEILRGFCVEAHTLRILFQNFDMVIYMFPLENYSPWFDICGAGLYFVTLLDLKNAKQDISSNETPIPNKKQDISYASQRSHNKGMSKALDLDEVISRKCGLLFPCWTIIVQELVLQLHVDGCIDLGGLLRYRSLYLKPVLLVPALKTWNLKTLALAYLCSLDDRKSIFVDRIGFNILLDLFQSSNSKHQEESCVALQNLAEKATSLNLVDAAGPSSPISQVDGYLWHLRVAEFCIFGPRKSFYLKQVYLGEQYVKNPTLSDVTFLIEDTKYKLGDI
ncbi:hypothetical protein Lser_V15G41342 [Lactuca serriola]